MDNHISRADHHHPTERAAFILACSAVGLVVGQSIGIAALGSATNGAIPLAFIGAIIGDAIWQRSRASGH